MAGVTLLVFFSKKPQEGTWQERAGQQGAGYQENWEGRGGYTQPLGGRSCLWAVPQPSQTSLSCRPFLSLQKTT